MWHLEVTTVLQRLSCGQLDGEVKLKIPAQQLQTKKAYTQKCLKDTSHQLFGLKSAILGQDCRLLSGPVMCSQALKKKR